MREALARSRNLVSIRLLRTTGINYSIDYATRFGFKRKHLPPNLTLALGTGLTTPLQMATAYAAFANQGFKVHPYFIERIEDSTGITLYEASQDIKRVCYSAEDPHCAITEKESYPEILSNSAHLKTASGQENIESQAILTRASLPTTAKRILDSRTHHHIVSMMQGVTKMGTAAKVQRVLKRTDLAGKTGTTNDQRDSWFCGFTPDYVAVAWAGFDDMSPLGDKETSTKVAVPMWIELMKSVLQNVPEGSWPQSPELIQADTNVGDEKANENEANRQAKQMAKSKQTEQQQPTTTEKQHFKYEKLQTAQTEPQSDDLSLVESLFLDTTPPAARPAQAPPPSPAPKAPQPVIESVEIPEQIF